MNRQPPTRRLSIGTLFYKRVFPWVFMAASALALITAARTATRGGESAAEYLLWAALSVIAYFVVRLIGSELADEVLDGGDHLIVRKDGIVEHIPLAEIEAVKESIWRRQPPQIELVLKAPGKLGRVIAFVPTNYTLVPLMRSPLTYELRDRVARASRESQLIRSRPTPR